MRLVVRTAAPSQSEKTFEVARTAFREPLRPEFIGVNRKNDRRPCRNGLAIDVYLGHELSGASDQGFEIDGPFAQRHPLDRDSIGMLIDDGIAQVEGNR